MADPLRLFAQLVAGEAAQSPDAARAFAVGTWRTYRDFLLANVVRARAEVAELRAEVASDLRSASPRGAKLEALDAIVRGALNDAVPALCARLANAMEAPFVEALIAAIARLSASEAVESSVIASWFAPHAVLGAQLARTSEIVRALLAHDGSVARGPRQRRVQRRGAVSTRIAVALCGAVALLVLARTAAYYARTDALALALVLAMAAALLGAMAELLARVGRASRARPRAGRAPSPRDARGHRRHERTAAVPPARATGAGQWRESAGRRSPGTSSVSSSCSASWGRSSASSRPSAGRAKR